MEWSNVLIIGGTGTLGQHIVNASVKLGHPTFLLVRSITPSDPAKAELLKSFQKAGVTLLVGDVGDYASLVAALKQVEVVISVVNRAPIAEQVNILEAAKEAGTIKRFIPSDFGFDMDKFQTELPIMKSVLESKIAIRRATEQSGIPYTYVSGFAFATYYLATILQESIGQPPPRDGKLVIYSDGNAKGVYVDEEDIGIFTIKCVDDPRAANKTLHIRPKENIASQNEMTAMWEKKIGHVFEKEVLDKDALLKSISELPFPGNFFRALIYHLCVEGNLVSDLDPVKDVEATSLYPDVKYSTMDEYLDRLAK
ncbi:unnamed protein product [Calypogeia fissa]